MVDKTNDRIIYLDNAAMTWPKPPSVIRAVSDCMKYAGGNPGRGAHRLSVAASETVYRCREKLAAMFDASPENVVFTLNTSYALNTAIKGVMHDFEAGKCHAVCSDIEHNSVWRPLVHARDCNRGDFSVYSSLINADNCSPARICTQIAKKITSETRVVICNHVSNICSYTMPIAEIGAFCKKHGYLFIVDAAQSAGHVPIDIRKFNIDILCLPGHKGLYGPAGLGVMILGDGVNAETLVQGGNGVNSLEGFMPDTTPERFEAGTLPVCAIAGLSEGISFVEEYGIVKICEHEKALFRRTKEGLSGIPGVTVYKPDYEGSVILFNIEGITSDTAARILDGHGICVRSGFHCASLAHKSIGTPETGAVRAGFGIFNSPHDVDILLYTVNDIAAGKLR